MVIVSIQNKLKVVWYVVTHELTRNTKAIYILRGTGVVYLKLEKGYKKKGGNMPKNVTLKFDFSKKVKPEVKPEPKPEPPEIKQEDEQPVKTKRLKFRKKRKKDIE